MPQLTIEGQFITLRPLNVNDADLTFGWRRGKRAKHLNSGADCVEQQAKWIEGRPDAEYNFIIELKDGRPVGMVSLTDIDPNHRHAQPGRFLIGDEQAVRGIPAAIEAMMLIYELAFETLGLARVHGTIASENALMIKWQKFLGMAEEGRQRNHLFIDGRFQDAVLFGMLSDEYQTKSRRKMELLIRAAK